MSCFQRDLLSIMWIRPPDIKHALRALIDSGKTTTRDLLNCIHYRLHSLAKQGDNALGSVHPSVCPSVCLSITGPILPMEPQRQRPRVMVMRRPSDLGVHTRRRRITALTPGAQRSILGSWLYRVQKRATTTTLPVSGYCLCVCNQSVFAINCVDAVNRFLIFVQDAVSDLYFPWWGYPQREKS